MKSILNVALLFGLLSGASNSLEAYELATHAGMTEKAAGLSVLSSDAFYGQYGISQWKNDLGQAYFDYQQLGPINRRLTYQFELDKFPFGSPVQRERDLIGWLMRGAVREDDGGYAYGIVAAFADGGR
jgi:hypothetical protein